MVRNEDFDNLTLNGDAVATGTDLSSHTGDTSNPHNVTASQAGALPDSGGTVTGDLTVLGDVISGADATETISGTGASLQFTGNDTRDIHDATDVSLSNASGASVTEDVTVDYYQGVDNTGTLVTSETQSVTLADAASTTVTYLTNDFALDTVDYYIEVTVTNLTADGIDEHTQAATYATSQTGDGDLVIQDGYGRVRARYDAVGDGLTVPSAAVTGAATIDGPLSVGANTELSESASGSTILQNTAGNPVNIQLSPSGRAFLSGNTTETVIDTQDQWYEISGAWSSAHLNFLSHTAGTLTYDGDVETQIMYDVGGAYSSPDQNATFEIAIFKDGAVKPNTPIDFSPPRAGETLSLPPIYGFTDSTTTGMSHSVRVRCTSGTTNLTVHSLSFRIKG